MNIINHDIQIFGITAIMSMKVTVIEIKTYQQKYLDKINPYLSNIVIDLQEYDTWKVLLTIAISFISRKHVDEERLMHSKSYKFNLQFYNNVNKVVDELFKLILSRYLNNLETPVRESDFIIDSAQPMYCKYHKVRFSSSGWYIDSPNWIKK